MGQVTLRPTRHKITQQEIAVSLLETYCRQSYGQSRHGPVDMRKPAPTLQHKRMRDSKKKEPQEMCD